MNDLQKKGVLVNIRHAESEWNLLGIWTGITDVNLTEKGRADAEKVGELLRDFTFDIAYTSDLKRTQQTLDHLLHGKGDQHQLPRIGHKALTERDYGELTGKNKWEVQQEIGEEAFTGIRRGWDYPVPGGENLKQVHGRVIPYFDEEILPRLMRGEHVLLVAHGNSLRALMKHLEDINEEQMADVEMPFGEAHVYTFEPGTKKPVGKEIRKAEITKTHA